jgi:UDP-arabinose 4-epimerase
MPVQVTVLITGLGYIGAQLAADLLQDGERVVAIENFFCTPRRAVVPLRSKLTLVEASINRPGAVAAVLAEHPARAVVHLAAQPSANPRAASAHYTELTNLTGARLVYEAAIAAGVERIVLGSSFKIYGDELPPVVDERQPYGKLGDLAHLSKLYAEKLLEMLANERTRGVSLRLGITYGVGPVMKRDPHFMTVPNLFAARAASRQPLSVVPGATQPAGFLHVQDASAAIRAALGMRLEESYGAVNVVGEVATVPGIADLVQRAGTRRGISVEITGAPSSPSPRSATFAVQTSLPAEQWSARRHLAEALEELLDYFLAETPTSPPARQLTSARA